MIRSIFCISFNSSRHFKSNIGLCWCLLYPLTCCSIRKVYCVVSGKSNKWVHTARGPGQRTLLLRFDRGIVVTLTLTMSITITIKEPLKKQNNYTSTNNHKMVILYSLSSYIVGPLLHWCLRHFWNVANYSVNQLLTKIRYVYWW